MELFLRRAVLSALLLLFSQGGWSQVDDLSFTVSEFVVSGDNPLVIAHWRF